MWTHICISLYAHMRDLGKHCITHAQATSFAELNHLLIKQPQDI